MRYQIIKLIYQKREGEMETTWSNIEKASEILGWKPEVDVLEWIN